LQPRGELNAKQIPDGPLLLPYLGLLLRVSPVSRLYLFLEGEWSVSDFTDNPFGNVMCALVHPRSVQFPFRKNGQAIDGDEDWGGEVAVGRFFCGEDVFCSFIILVNAARRSSVVLLAWRCSFDSLANVSFKS
jgi:hypothetical protein